LALQYSAKVYALRPDFVILIFTGNTYELVRLAGALSVLLLEQSMLTFALNSLTSDSFIRPVSHYVSEPMFSRPETGL